MLIKGLAPHEIEKESFRRIEVIARDHDLPPDEWSVLRRMIHTSGDPSIRKDFRIHPEAVRAGVDALLGGCTVTADTRMLLAGISTGRLERLGVSAICLIDDPEVWKKAQETGTTRAVQAMDASLLRLDGGIAAIGNAPTALLRLIEHMENGRVRPALVIGVPVGFVNAEEAKEMLLTQQISPFVTILGTRGGSALAASVVNALAEIALAEIGDATCE